MEPSHIGAHGMGDLHISSQRQFFALFIGNRLFNFWHRIQCPLAEMWTLLTREYDSTVFRSISHEFGPRELSEQNEIVLYKEEDIYSSCIS